jgi:hypothetical protein
MSDKEIRGEGNKTADRRYRSGVAGTVADTTPEERRKNALNLSEKERAEAEEAARRARDRARS